MTHSWSPFSDQLSLPQIFPRLPSANAPCLVPCAPVNHHIGALNTCKYYMFTPWQVHKYWWCDLVMAMVWMDSRRGLLWNVRGPWRDLWFIMMSRAWGISQTISAGHLPSEPLVWREDQIMAWTEHHWKGSLHVTLIPVHLMTVI